MQKDILGFIYLGGEVEAERTDIIPMNIRQERKTFDGCGRQGCSDELCDHH